MNYCYKKEGFYCLLLLTDLTYVNIIYTHTAASIFLLSPFFFLYLSLSNKKGILFGCRSLPRQSYMQISYQLIFFCLLLYTLIKKILFFLFVLLSNFNFIFL